MEYVFYKKFKMVPSSFYHKNEFCAETEREAELYQKLPDGTYYNSDYKSYVDKWKVQTIKNSVIVDISIQNIVRPNIR